MKTLDELLNSTITVDCQTCQGHTIPGLTESEHGYCPVCKSKGIVRVSEYARLTDGQRVKVLENEVMRLRPDLAERYKKS